MRSWSAAHLLYELTEYAYLANESLTASRSRCCGR